MGPPLGNRLKQLQAHDALCLLQNALAIPKVLYFLRTAPSFRSTVLTSFDGVLRTLLETICNIHLNDQSWTQASLPTYLGGLGIWSVTMLAPSAFLASAAGTSHIVRALLPPATLPATCPHEEEVLGIWKSVSGSVPPTRKQQASRGRGTDLPLVSLLPVSYLGQHPLPGPACWHPSKKRQVPGSLHHLCLPWACGWTMTPFA